MRLSYSIDEMPTGVCDLTRGAECCIVEHRHMLFGWASRHFRRQSFLAFDTLLLVHRPAHWRVALQVPVAGGCDNSFRSNVTEPDAMT